MWILTVRSPSSAPIDFELKPGKITLGRKPDNDIVISDESASRLHAEIYYQEGQAVINDVGSTNGTYVNRERIFKPHVFQSGDQIRIGECVIHVTCQQNGGTPPLVQALVGTRPLTRDLILESIDQNAIFLGSVSSRLTMILNLDMALQEISETIQRVLGVDKASVILADHFDQLSSLEIPFSITRRAVDLQSVVIYPDPGVPDLGSGNGDEKKAVSVALCVPVKVEQVVVALIYAYKTDPLAKPFGMHDIQLAVAMSHQAALTIQREMLLQESHKLEELANIDSLTGLHNRRQILNLAELEFQRAQRFNHPLTTLLLDLDNLKSINDNQGHLVGDQALQAMAGVCKKMVRAEDSVGRLGGDEFLVLLVEATLEEGRAVADRICKSIKDFQIKYQAEFLNITVSIGVASRGEDCSTFTDLLNKADVGLMKAKKDGKDQIVTVE
jgi:diguanylate cyclase (GGDEF)-like protein